MGIQILRAVSVKKKFSESVKSNQIYLLKKIQAIKK